MGMIITGSGICCILTSLLLIEFVGKGSTVVVCPDVLKLSLRNDLAMIHWFLYWYYIGI